MLTSILAILCVNFCIVCRAKPNQRYDFALSPYYQILRQDDAEQPISEDDNFQITSTTTEDKRNLGAAMKLGRGRLQLMGKKKWSNPAPRWNSHQDPPPEMMKDGSDQMFEVNRSSEELENEMYDGVKYSVLDGGDLEGREGWEFQDGNQPMFDGRVERRRMGSAKNLKKVNSG